MENNHNHISYTAADFERYHNGTMPVAEMYALEKAALEDPFLADALDGYVFAKTPVADIEELAQQIPPKKEDKKTPVVAFNTWWLRIAAVFILVTGIGYIIYRSNDSNDQPISNTLAENKNNAVVAPVTERADSSHPATDTKKTDPAIAKGSTQVTTTQNGLISPSSSVKDDYKKEDEDKDRSAGKDFYAVQEKNQSELVKKLYRLPAKQYNLKGTVTDQSGAPVPFASVTLKDHQGTQADANGNFSLQAKDSMILANISASGYAAINQNLNFKSNQNIVLERKSTELSEVVVTGYATQKRKEMTGAATAVQSKDIASAPVPGLNVQPVDGMMRYDKYLDSSRIQVLQQQTQPLKGQVILSFKVNRQGEPIRIKVEKSLSKEYDETATRLLKQGPKWQFSHGKRVNKTIEF